MPEGSSSKKPLEKTGFDCPVFWRRIGAPLAILLIVWPHVMAIGLRIVAAILEHAYGYRFFGTTAFEKSLVYNLFGGPVFICLILAPGWWVMLGLAALRGAASRKTWIFCTAIGSATIAFYTYLLLSEM